MSDYPFYEGYFWVIDFNIPKKNYIFECMKIPCDYEGNYDKEIACKDGITPAFYWNNHFKDNYYDRDYEYYPSGKVSIHEGIAYVKLPPYKIVFGEEEEVDEDATEYLKAKILKMIIKEYNLKNKLKIEVI